MTKIRILSDIQQQIAFTEFDFYQPIDLIPDFIPVVGYSDDDIAALAYSLHAVWKNVTPEIKEQAQRKLREWFGNFNPCEVVNLW